MVTVVAYEVHRIAAAFALVVADAPEHWELPHSASEASLRSLVEVFLRNPIDIDWAQQHLGPLVAFHWWDYIQVDH